METFDLRARCRYCLFRNGSSWFAVPAVSIREVTFRPRLATVPNPEPALAGLCHFRNEFLPVISLGRLLAHDPTAVALESQMLVLFGPNGPWALLIDEVAALEPLETSSAAQSGAQDEFADAIAGWARFRDYSVQVLDPNGLYRLAVGLLDEQWADGDDEDRKRNPVPESVGDVN